MSIRLRPMGKPCLRSPRGALMAVAGVVALTAAPATAAYADHVKPLGWYAEETPVPATVQFEDVATDGSTVLAAGRNGDAETGTAAIFRRVGDGWQAEALPTLAAPSTITDVAVSGAKEWAIGTAGGAPVVLERTGGGWLTPQGAEQITGAPVSVDVRGSTALVGDGQGNLHFFTAGGATPPQEPLAAGPISGVAVTGEGAGVAVAAYEPFPLFDANSVRIYSVSTGSEPLPEHDANARAAGVNMLGVATTSNGAATAFDSSGATWHRTDDGDWVQGDDLVDAGLNGVASLALPNTNNVREALAGSVGTEGAIWQRDRYRGHDAPWQRQPLAAGTKPLAAVALTGPESGFAVGADGTVLRLWRPPDPEAHAAAEQAAADAAYQAYLDELAAEEAANQAAAAEAERQEQERLAAEQAAAEQAAAEQAAAEQAAAEQQQQEPTAEPSSPPPPAPVEQDDIRMNGVVIDDSEPRETRTGQRLLKNVRAVRRGQKLIVSFRLTAKARVGLTAKRGRRVIAKTGMRTLRRGRRQLVLRFRGRPPSSLKVVVRRVSGARDNR